jgi:hypothetical protein
MTDSVTGTVDSKDFHGAMRLLGLDPDNPERALVSVEIANGHVHATYAQVRTINGEQIVVTEQPVTSEVVDWYAEVFDLLAQHFPDCHTRRVRECTLAIVKRLGRGS